MTSPRRRLTDEAPVRPAAARARARLLSGLCLYALIFALNFLLHLPLLRQPLEPSELARELRTPETTGATHTGETLITERANASAFFDRHPPLLPAYLALVWKIFGAGLVWTRAAMLAVSALALYELFRLARRVANAEVAAGTCLAMALYTVFFADAVRVHAELLSAALALRGLSLYLSAQLEVRRLLAATLFFALAALAHETAALVPVGLVTLSALAPLGEISFNERRSSRKGAKALRRPAERARVLVLLLALAPLVLWLVVARMQGGGPSFLHISLNPIASFGERLWQLTAHGGLYLLTLAMVVAMFLKPRTNGGAERQRILIPTQMAFAAIMLAYALGLAFAGVDEAPRHMLLPVALVQIISVSTLRRRLRWWTLVLIGICLAFAVFSFASVRLAAA